MNIIYGDVERFKDHVIEYSFIRHDQFLHGFICPIISHQDQIEFNKQAHFSHCIDYHLLKELGEPSWVTRIKIHSFFREAVELIENSQENDMDVARFVKKFEITIKFTSKPLPPWIDRIKLPSFHITKRVKENGFRCPFHTLKFYSSGKGETKRVKELYGHHCSFYDTYFISILYGDFYDYINGELCGDLK